MPVGFKRVLLVKYSSIITSTSVLASAIALAQSELDSVHIFPRENAQVLPSANVAAAPGHRHTIKQNIDLVLVPVRKSAIFCACTRRRDTTRVVSNPSDDSLKVKAG
jgi:hypothetical protein